MSDDDRIPDDAYPEAAAAVERSATRHDREDKTYREVAPNDPDAERAVIGALLVNPKVACEIALALLTPDDFFSFSRGVVFEAIDQLWQDGQPVDMVTVMAQLDRTQPANSLHREWAQGLLHAQTTLPSSSRVGKYCELIIDCSARRRVAAVSDEMYRLAMENELPGVELLELAKERFESVDAETTLFLPDGLTTLDDFLNRPEDEYAPWVIPGMIRRNWRVLLVAGEGAGKALAVDTPIATPNGWTTMGALRPGDQVFGSDGQPVAVLAATEPMLDRPCYRVGFTDESIIADADHRWIVVDYAGRQHGHWDRTERTTAQLADEGAHARDGFCANYLIERTPPLDLPDVDLPLDPYVLGVWLGDGTSRHGTITTIDQPVIDEIHAAGWETKTRDGVHWIVHRQSEDDALLEQTRQFVAAGAWTRDAERRLGLGRGALAAAQSRTSRQRISTRATLSSVLRRMNLLQNKRIPTAYFRASVAQREALLAGLLDADGSAQRNSVELTLCDPQLAGDAIELIRTLGYRPTAHWSDAKLNSRVVGRRCRIRFTPDRPVFRLARKQAVLAGSCHYRSISRYVVDVVRVESVPVRCIQVDAPDGIFLAGRTMVRTHNSVLLRQMGIAAAAGLHPLTRTKFDPVRVLMIDGENPDEAIEEVCLGMRNEAERAGDWDPDRLWLWRQPAGMDLRQRRDRIELESVIRAARPDLVCLGPMYKTYVTKSKDEEEPATRQVTATLDVLRIRYKFGLLMEHHAPMGTSGKRRELRPHGSAFWMRWPELGISMNPKKDSDTSFRLGRFRGDRLPNQWPEELLRSGGPWLWAGIWPPGTFDPRKPEDNEPMF